MISDLSLVAIIAANVLISYKGFNDLTFFRKYEFNIKSILSGEQIRIISSGFLHVDFVHLIFNMITLWFFAPVVIAYLGQYSFLTIYFGSLIFGSLLTMYFHKNDFYYRAVGASGAVTGVLYSAIILNPNMMIGVFFVIPMPAYLFGVLYLLYSIYGMKSRNDGIGHAAHFGGAIGGYIITLIIYPATITNNPVITILLMIPIVLMFILIKAKKI